MDIKGIAGLGRQMREKQQKEVLDAKRKRDEATMTIKPIGEKRGETGATVRVKIRPGLKD